VVIADRPRGRVGEVTRVFLRLGLTAFGGPAAHIAAMEDEFVQRRGWVSREEFVDLLSAANVIPGPNSTELAIHLGYARAGWAGLVAAGVAFIMPATAIVWMIAMGYGRYGQRPEVAALLAGMQPVVLAVVVQALWRLSRGVLRTPALLAIGVASAIAVVAGAHELLVLASAALAGLLLRGRLSWPRRSTAFGPELIVSTAFGGTAASAAASIATSIATGAATLTLAAAPTTLGLFGAFLKIGSVLFGSGYVLLAFLRAEFVTRHGWLTEAQLLDAIAIGQVTPGPVFTAATFVGYVLAGHGGAAAATLGIFLPAFLFVALSGPLVRRVRQSPRASAALDGVNAASLALLVGVALLMMQPVARSAMALGIFVVAAALLLHTKVGAGWMLLAGALAGAARILLFHHA
jgi:chromate transporter